MIIAPFLASIVAAFPTLNLTNYAKGLNFDRIVVAVFENQNYNTVSKVPEFQQLALKGNLLTNYRGLKHPSQPVSVGLDP